MKIEVGVWLAPRLCYICIVSCIFIIDVLISNTGNPLQLCGDIQISEKLRTERSTIIISRYYQIISRLYFNYTD